MLNPSAKRVRWWKSAMDTDVISSFPERKASRRHPRISITSNCRRRKEAAEELAAKLKDSRVTIKAKTGTSGKLFGAISSKEIALAFAKQTGLELDKKKLLMDEPIRELGTHVIKARLHKDVIAEVTVNVVEE